MSQESQQTKQNTSQNSIWVQTYPGKWESPSVEQVSGKICPFVCRHIKDGASLDICIYPQNLHYNQGTDISLWPFVIHPSLHPHPQTTTDLPSLTADLFVLSGILSRKESGNAYSFLSSLKHNDFKIIHVVLYVSTLFFCSSILLSGYTICLTIYLLMSPWVIPGVISKAAMNICVQVFVQKYAFLFFWLNT